MNTITSINKDYFKSYLRYYSKSFVDSKLDSNISLIYDLLSFSSVGINSNSIDKVNVFPFKNGETISITTAINNREYFYFPGFENDIVNVSINSNVYQFFFGSDFIAVNGFIYEIDDSFEVNGAVLTVVGIGGALLLPSDGPSYEITPSSTSINEGNSVIFTINTKNVSPGTTLYYSTGGNMSASDFADNSLTGSFNIVGIGSTAGIATVTRTISGDFLSEGTESFTFVVRTGSVSGPVVGSSASISVANVEPTFTITPSITNTSEGNSVVFTINTTNISNGTTLYYSTLGTVNASDFIGGSLTGSFSIVGTGLTTGIATITRSIANDFNTEGTENFQLQIRTESTSGPIVATSSLITVADVVSNYVITPSKDIVNEGESITFNINTANVSNGTTLYYTISGTINDSDFTDNLLSGSFTITNNSGSFTKTIVSDFNSEDTEYFTVSIRRDSISGSIVATSSSINVLNVIPSYIVTASLNSVNEGTTVSFTVTAEDTPSNTTLYYTIAGITTSSDFTDNTLSGSFVLNNGTAIVTKTLTADRLSEGAEQFYFQVRRTSVSDAIVATSQVIVVNDTSVSVGQNANGLTFGPIQVNRDEGNSANASDWYSICSLDNLPDDSKIALFIDNSGSMTTATIQASYNLLLSKLAERNISIITVNNGNEDWITPFLVDLN